MSEGELNCRCHYGLWTPVCEMRSELLVDWLLRIDYDARYSSDWIRAELNRRVAGLPIKSRGRKRRS